MNCVKCRFYDPNQVDTDPGVCKRYPAPIVVLPSHWCGEFRPRQLVAQLNTMTDINGHSMG